MPMCSEVIVITINDLSACIPREVRCADTLPALISGLLKCSVVYNWKNHIVIA